MSRKIKCPYSVGVDSTRFVHGKRDRYVEALLGVTVSTPDDALFKESYDQAIEDVFDEFGKKRTRRVYKSADIAALFARKEIDIIGNILEKCSNLISRIDIFYSRYDTKHIPKVFVYSKDRPDNLTPVEFVRKIENSYPHICVWGCLGMYPEALDCVFYMDHFEGELTSAWDQISQLKMKRRQM